jgi:Fe-S-cluster-containing dehydrogenase component/DMSO reductase anchor subunit
MIASVQSQHQTRTLIDALLEEQRDLTAVERFARWHDSNNEARATSSRVSIPLTLPKAGEQYAFEVDLDRCSGCKSCVTACHALNGLDDDETWRNVGLLRGQGRNNFQQTVTTACHHCLDPACLNGCPVLAYDKDPLTGIVRHLDDQCIGCQYCIFMCPYEVPKYSRQRGIVRKCDMCQQRLEHREAPACVEACPSQAIRITVVEQKTLRQKYDSPSPGRAVTPANPFLPDSPDPTITLPATRYISARPLPAGLFAADSHEASLQPAHLTLVWLLTLTQLGAGSFLLLPFTTRAVQPILATAGLGATLLGLAGSILHLGRPQKAWRAFLGFRRSWMSREIVGFMIFALLAAATTLATVVGGDRVHPWKLPLFSATSLMAVLVVFCSGMTYHATQRECWKGALSVGRFFGTMLVLGAAAAWAAAALRGLGHNPFAIVLPLATLVKLSREFAFLRLCPDNADLDEEPPRSLVARSAFLMRFRLGGWLRFRFTCAWMGGILLPLLGWLIHPATALAIAALSFCLVGELIERVLFFRAAATAKMPGGIAT